MVESTFDKKFWKILIPFVVLIFVILFFPYLLTSYSWFGLDFTGSGGIGDTIGGTIGPFVAIIATFLTFIAFWVQYKANEQMRRDVRIDRLENRIYELLKLHRDNVTDLKLTHYRDNIQLAGREIFPVIFEELKLAYFGIKKLIEEKIIEKINDEIKITEAAQLIIFIGVKSTDNDLLKNKLNKLFSTEISELIIKRMWQLRSGAVDRIDFGDGFSYKLSFRIVPFKGYIATLGHYYRHLYQMVRYIDEFPSHILDNQSKYAYIKTIRAQLSSHEQLILYYNCLTEFGKSWNTKRYIVKYKFIKNIPLPLADFGLKPTEKYKDEIVELRKRNDQLFEWN